MNKGYDMNGYVTDYTKLNEFNRHQVDYAMESLDHYLFDNDYEILCLIETRLDGSHVFGSTQVVESDTGFTKTLNFIVDFYGNLTIN